MFEGIEDHQKQQRFEKLRLKREEDHREVNQTFDTKEHIEVEQ